MDDGQRPITIAHLEHKLCAQVSLKVAVFVQSIYQMGYYLVYVLHKKYCRYLLESHQQDESNEYLQHNF